MKTVFAYIRVSTTKQGSEGASLPEQRYSIEAYCKRNNLHILRWFEEQETAAKKGRKEFTEMMRLVKRGKAGGLVFHKIDRSSRNLADWAEVSSLPEIGIDVHYSHEPVDLKSTHGRTAADVAAVFAASYIRNLRDEVKKGIQGRLKQGIYPFGAPVGYLNQGGGKLKIIDPEKGPLVRKLFERYATGEYSLRDLMKMAADIGLTSNFGEPINLAGISRILHNSFYIGLLSMKRSGEIYEGKHEPLISQTVFRRVQDVITGRVVPKKTRERYLFQMLLSCTSCGYHLIAERQKGYLYYRCHHCSGVCLRETAIERTIEDELAGFQFTDREKDALRESIDQVVTEVSGDRKTRLRSLRLQIDSTTLRIDRLTDNFLDGTLSKDEYEKRKGQLLAERMEFTAKEADMKQDEFEFSKSARKKIELIFSLQDKYISGNVEEKRHLLRIMTSNMAVSQKTVTAQWKSPFYELQKSKVSCVVAFSEANLEHNITQISHTDTEPPWIREFAKILIEYVMTGGHELLPFLPKLPPRPLFGKGRSDKVTS